MSVKIPLTDDDEHFKTHGTKSTTTPTNVIVCTMLEEEQRR